MTPSTRPSIWAQSLRGKAIDLLHPTADDVDFHEIAHVLAGINRYAGHAQVPVSVAFHSLLAAEAAAPDIRPYVLLHDAHEARGIGDIATPAAEALDAIVADLDPEGRADIVCAALAELKARHDAVIWAAAKLPPPTPSQAARIRHCDLVALATERRDFLSASPKRWAAAVEAAAPLPIGCRPTRFGKIPFAIAETLYEAFRDHLPCFGTSVPVPATGAAP